MPRIGRSRDTFELFGQPIELKDLQDAANGDPIRFIADYDDEDLWVWDADAALHSDVWYKKKFVGKNREDMDLMATNELIWGVAEKQGSKWVMDSSDELSGMNNQQIKLSKPNPNGVSYDDKNYGTVDFNKISENFKWLNRYINITKWLRRHS
jgi:hypothetical protein